MDSIILEQNKYNLWILDGIDSVDAQSIHTNISPYLNKIETYTHTRSEKYPDKKAIVIYADMEIEDFEDIDKIYHDVADAHRKEIVASESRNLTIKEVNQLIQCLSNPDIALIEDDQITSYQSKSNLEYKFDENLTLKSNFEGYLYHKYVSDEGIPIWFTSTEVKKDYDDELKQNIKLSTASTYLSRMYREELLLRKGHSDQRKYKLLLENWDHDKGIPKIRT